MEPSDAGVSLPAGAPPMPGLWLEPDRALGVGVRARISLVQGVTTEDPWGRFNTADHVGDDPSRVVANRKALRAALALPYAPLWLDQVHGIDVVRAGPDTCRQAADAVYTACPGLPITLHTADCLPLFVAADDGREIALAHGGWRGLAAGIIPATIRQFAAAPDKLVAWMGPAIGPTAFEVGDEVRAAFLATDSMMHKAFTAGEIRNGRQHWWCDIYGIARRQLGMAGVTRVTGGDYCTVRDGRFFSYRRAPVTGRMLSLMWIPVPD